MDLNIKYKNNLEFIDNTNLRINIYKNFFYKRNSYNIFKNDGKFNIHKNEYSIFRYIRHLMYSKKKWGNFLFKRRYLTRKRFKKQYLRIRNYIKKNLLTQEYINQFKIKNLFYDTCTRLNFNKNTNYNLNFFELIFIKIRFILNILKKTNKNYENGN